MTTPQPPANVRIRRRARKLFRSRFLREAESPEAEQKINNELDEKITSRRARLNEHILDSLRQARKLWAQREVLDKRDFLLLAAALLYFISPLDAVPDVIPGIGYVDDALVLTWVLARIGPPIKAKATAKAEEAKDAIRERAKDFLRKKVRENPEVFEEIGRATVDGAIDQTKARSPELMHRATRTVALGIWGTTTAAAISISVRCLLGETPTEWIVYTAITGGLVLLWNVSAAAHVWKQYRGLDEFWQDKFQRLLVQPIRTRDIVVVGVPVVALLLAGLIRVWIDLG